MRKILFLCMAAALFGGCMERQSCSTVLYREGSDTVTITGKNVKVEPLLQRLIAAKGWRQEGAGARALTQYNVKIVNGSRVQKESKTIDGQMFARTEDGKTIRFDVHNENNNKATIRMSIEGEGGESAGQYMTELMSFIVDEKIPESDTDVTITVTGLKQDEQSVNVFSGRWVSNGNWKSDHVTLEIKYGASGAEHSKRFVLSRGDILPVGEFRQLADLKSFEFSRRGGVIIVEADENLGQGFGEVKIQVDAAYLKAISEACSDISANCGEDTMLRIFFSNIDAAYAIEISKMFDKGITLEEIQKLNSYHVDANYIEELAAAGYSPVAKDIKKSGTDIDVSDIVKLKNYHVKTADAVSFKKAGYNFGVSELVKAKNYNLSPEYSSSFLKAGYKFSLDELIKLKNYHVSAEDAGVWKQGGYDFGTRELIKAKNYHLKADNAVKFKNAGYDLSIDDLVKLSNYHVSSEFMFKVADPEYENFTVSELIDMRNKNISAETILKLRKKKVKDEIATGS